MTKRVKFGELPEHFQKLEDGSREGSIRQANGDVFALYRATAEMKEAMLAVNHTCGVCAAAHIADLAKTRSYPSYGSDVQCWNGWGDLNPPLEAELAVLENRQVRFRSFRDGVLTLFKTLLGSRTFVDWFNNKYEDGKTMRLGDKRWRRKMPFGSVADCLQEYVRSECGGPDHCFSCEDWPMETPYHKVLGKMVELNPDIRDAELAVLTDAESIKWEGAVM